jgi:hypothetical protein
MQEAHLCDSHMCPWVCRSCARGYVQAHPKKLYHKCPAEGCQRPIGPIIREYLSKSQNELRVAKCAELRCVRAADHSESVAEIVALGLAAECRGCGVLMTRYVTTRQSCPSVQCPLCGTTNIP